MGGQGHEINNLVRALDRFSLAIERAHPQQEEWEVVSDPPEEPARNTQQTDFQRKISRIPFGDYDAFAELLPVVPGHLLRLGNRLSEGQYTAEYRIKRAWEAGFWASLVLAEKRDKPRATLPLNIRPCIYSVLRAPGLGAPTRVASASDLHRITGRFNERTLCHGFPSLAEAEAYCCAAGVDLPCQHQWN